jgi:hypothetical protein
VTGWGCLGVRARAGSRGTGEREAKLQSCCYSSGPYLVHQRRHLAGDLLHRRRRHQPLLPAAGRRARRAPAATAAVLRRLPRQQQRQQVCWRLRVRLPKEGLRGGAPLLVRASRLLRRRRLGCCCGRGRQRTACLLCRSGAPAPKQAKQPALDACGRAGGRGPGGSALLQAPACATAAT